MAELTPLHAWVDESIQEAEFTGAFYVLAGTITPVNLCPSIREDLRNLLARGSDRIHWKHEKPARQETIASAIARLGLSHIVVAAAPVNSRRPERSRRIAMERLFVELDSRSVEHVWIESRTSADNGRDQALLQAARTRKVISSDLRVDFAKPFDEPMLWLPDVVAGAYGYARKGTNERPWDTLRLSTTAIELNI